MFGEAVDEMLTRADAKEIRDYLADYHELESCCEGKDWESECEFAALRKKLNELTTPD